LKKVHARNADILSSNVGPILYMMLFSTMATIEVDMVTGPTPEPVCYVSMLFPRLVMFVQIIVVNLFIGLRSLFSVDCPVLKKWCPPSCYTVDSNLLFYGLSCLWKKCSEPLLLRYNLPVCKAVCDTYCCVKALGSISEKFAVM
jgi:hypothetical protein